MHLPQLDVWLSASHDDGHDDAHDDGVGDPGRTTSGSLDRGANRLGRSDPMLTDTRQIERLRAGDESAFEQLFFEHAAPLRRFVRAMLHGTASAEDIVQESFAQLWERRETVEIKTSLRSYLYAAARGRALTALRAAGVREAYAAQTVTEDVVVVPARAPDALARLEHDELTRALGAALAALPPRVRQAAELRWFAKLSHAEIASVMGTAPATVNNQLTTALRTLRELLQPYLDR